MACQVCQKIYVPTEDVSLDSDVKPHVCNTCGQSFSLKIQLKRHMIVHADNAPYTCYSCEKNESNSKTYNLRLTKKGNFPCNDCGASFSTRRLLLRHSKEHEIEAESSEDSDENFETEQTAPKKPVIRHKTKRSYSKQKQSEVTIKLHNCSDCGKEFSDSLCFLKHRSKHRKNICKDCNKSFVLRSTLEKHRLSGKCKGILPPADDTNNVQSGKKPNNLQLNSSIAGDKKHVCDICGKSFSRLSSLEGHVLLHMAEDSSESSAEEDSRSSQELELKNNNSIDENSPLSEKEENAPLIKNKELEKTHKKLPLPKLKIRAFKCEKCTEIFSSKKALKEHSLTHITVEANSQNSNEDTTFTCSSCGEILNSKEDLQSHFENSHSGEIMENKIPKRRYRRKRTYLCEICDKVFCQKSKIKKHQLFHENKLEDDVSSDDVKNIITKRISREKNHACEKCGKKFAGERCLQKHLEKHDERKEEEGQSSETPAPKRRKNAKILICEFCNEDFTGKKNVFLKHKISHTPEICGICDERFVDRQSLKEHCRVHIGTEKGRVFLECSQKAFKAKNGTLPPEPKVEYIYLVLR